MWNTRCFDAVQNIFISDYFIFLIYCVLLVHDETIRGSKILGRQSTGMHNNGKRKYWTLLKVCTRNSNNMAVYTAGSSY
jgi:hypothetical protein